MGEFLSLLLDISPEAQFALLVLILPVFLFAALILKMVLMPFGLGRVRKRGLIYLYAFPAIFGLIGYLSVRDIPIVQDVIRFYRKLSGAGAATGSWARDNHILLISLAAGLTAFFIFVICAMYFTRTQKAQRNTAVNYLVLLRHGQSQWNLENRFTGFHDIDLSDLGRQEAADAGRRLKNLGVTFDAVYTSTLQRAYNTACIALENAGQGSLIPKIIRHDDLRERDYGDLTGLNKDETRAKYGDEQVHIWRRSYDVCPPGGECLKDVVEKRVRPYYAANIAQQLLDGKNILVTAHGNSLRALLIILGAETPETINAAEMETGVPVVFELENGKILKRYALTDKKAA